MTSRSQPNLPATLPARPCDERDLFRDYVGEGREYHGHNGDCENCGVKFSESEDSDLATAHWMHGKAVAQAMWERDQPKDLRDLAAVLDPDDPMGATEHARNLIASRVATEVPAATDDRRLVTVGKRVHKVEPAPVRRAGAPLVAYCGTVFVPTEFDLDILEGTPDCLGCETALLGRLYWEADRAVDEAERLAARLRRAGHGDAVSR